MKLSRFIVFFVLTITLICIGGIFANADISLDNPSIGVDAVKKEYVFSVKTSFLSNSQSANVVVASYDAQGGCIAVNAKAANTSGATTLRLGFDSMDASYKVMLLDGHNSIKPLCAAVCGALPKWDYTKTLTFTSEDVSGYDETTRQLSYYPSDDTAMTVNTVRIDDSVECIDYSGYKMYMDKLLNLIDTEDVIFELADTNADSLYDKISATKYTYDVIEQVDLSKNMIALIENGALYLDFDDPDISITINDTLGNTLELTDLAAGDAVAVVADSDRISYFSEHITITRLLNNVVRGTVEELYSKRDFEYIVIDEKEYMNISHQDISTGDEGIFYITLTGRVFRYDIDYDALNYGYILEGGYTSGSFSGDTWSFTLLTEDGRVITHDARSSSAAKEYVNTHTDAFTLTDCRFEFEDATAKEKRNKARLVTYKIYANNKIVFDIAQNYNFKAINKDSNIYSLSTKTITNYKLSDNLLVFDVSGGVNGAVAADISHLEDFVGYSGFLFSKPIETRAYSIMLITDKRDFGTEPSTSLAIVTQADETQIKCIQDQREKVLTITDALVGNFDGRLPGFGDAFIYSDGGDGNVETITTVATLEKDSANQPYLELTGEFDTPEELKALLGDEYEIVLGYIINEGRIAFSAGEGVEVSDGEMYIIRNTCNVYVYDTSGDNESVYADFYLEYAYDNGKKVEVSPILMILKEEEAVDVYTTTGRFELP